MVGGGVIAVYEDDGSLIRSTFAGALGMSPPCAADFDGDGEVEVAFAYRAAFGGSATFGVFELDGTRLWGQAVSDTSGLSGCSGYDVDGDGAFEILYTDEESFSIFDGATGTVHFNRTDHASVTLFEFPTVADVDNDGSAEILFVSNHGFTGSHSAILTVLGHDGGGWARSVPTWHAFDFSVSNIEQDGTVPSTPPPYWLDHNVVRARPNVDGASMDFEVMIADVCYAGCLDDSKVKVSAQVFNTGGKASYGDIAVSLYAEDETESRWLDTVVLADPIQSGEGAAAVVFEVRRDDVGTRGFRVKVDDEGTGLSQQVECDERNNEAFWSDVPC